MEDRWRGSIRTRGFKAPPDIAFLSRRKAIFVHGCFWHGHDCARGARTPKTNAAYWSAKIARNRARDAAQGASLAALGWSVLTLWECELADAEALTARLRGFVDG